VFVCSQLHHTYSAVFLLLVTAASDLLVHKILLNSVRLSPIVSGGVRPTSHPRKNTSHNPPPCWLPFVGRLGSGTRLVGRIRSVVLVSVSFQQEYPPGSVLPAAGNGVMTKGVVSGGLTSLHLRRITSSQSQTLRCRSSCANNGRRTPRCARRSPPSVAAFHTSRLVRLITMQQC